VIAPNPQAPLMDVHEAAEFLGLHVKTIYRMVETGQLPYVRIGGRTVRFAPSQLATFIGAMSRPVEEAAVDA
jgi:excisionase family DNA binding protein